MSSLTIPRNNEICPRITRMIRVIRVIRGQISEEVMEKTAHKTGAV